MSDPSSAGPEHDAWLREALRHAPDASASPPPSLSDAILAEARAVARSGATRRAVASPASTRVDRVLAFWSWLARPPVAAGFASVMAATLVGMLWWDRPMDETMLPPPSSPAVAVPKSAQERGDAAVQRPSPPAEADRAAPPAGRIPEAARSTAPASELRESTPAPAKAAAPRAAETAAMEAERKQQAARATADERARSRTKLAARSEEAAAAGKTDKLEAAPPPAPTTTPATRATPPPAPGVARPAAEAPSPFPAPPPAEADAAPPSAAPAAVPPSPAAVPPTTAAAPPLPTTPSPQPPAPATGRNEPFALAKKAESGEKEGVADKARSAPAAGPLGGAARDSSEASSTGRAAAQNAARPAARQAAPAVASARPMAPLLAALTSEEQRWARRLANGESGAVDVALRNWLAQVQSAAAARWQSAGEPGARRDGPVAASTVILHLERDGRAGATVQIVDGGVLFFDPLSGGAWFAPLPPDVVARLRATVPPAPR